MFVFSFDFECIYQYILNRIGQVSLGMGSEPKIISTMASKSSIQSPNHVSLIGNPDAEKIYHGLLVQHKARKIEDPVIITRNGERKKVPHVSFSIFLSTTFQ